MGVRVKSEDILLTNTFDIIKKVRIVPTDYTRQIGSKGIKG